MADITYRPLGFLENKYYYYSFLLQKVVALTPVEHRKENLFALAPYNYWVSVYGDKKEAWALAADSLIQTCASEGLFNPANIIGRGIWLIDGEGVAHYGDKIRINNKTYNPRQVPAELAKKKVFELSESLQLSEPNPHADFTAIESTLSELHFKTPHAALLISGWIVCAMAAGALHWRPHGWVTGKSGYGKSAVIKVIKRILGNCAEYYTGETTEAGIRQDLKHDCRAVVFDEAEPKTPHAQNLIQKVLNLFRQASSDETAKIAKGTATGKGITFKVRSCAFMGSVNPYLTEEPDKNRFFVVEMGMPISKEEYTKWEYRMENVFDNGFQSALHGHISDNIVTLAANAKMFASVLAERFQNNRAGDQYGTLMAGAYLLTSTDLVTKEIAADWVRDLKLPPDSEIEEKSDEKDLWNYMLERMIPLKKMSNDKILSFDRPLSEVIEAAFGNYTSAVYTQRDAEISLSDKGIKAIVENDIQYVAVSTSHSAIADLIVRSRFAGLEWSPILQRLPAAKASKKPYRIGTSKKLSKATLIPWSDEDVTKVTKGNIEVTKDVIEF